METTEKIGSINFLFKQKCLLFLIFEKKKRKKQNFMFKVEKEKMRNIHIGTISFFFGNTMGYLVKSGNTSLADSLVERQMMLRSLRNPPICCFSIESGLNTYSPFSITN